MRVRLIVGWLVVLSVVAAIGYAQQPPAARPDTVRLSLAEALETAIRNNPTYLTTLRARSPAAWARNSAELSLFTPTFGLGGSYYHQAAATGQVFQGFQIPATPSYKQLSGSLRFGYQLSGASIANVGSAGASLQAADQDVSSALTALEVQVRTEYLNLLEARAQADLAQHVVQRAQELLNLAEARYSVGQNTMIDVRQAQVAKGNADVSLLQAQQNVQIEALKVYQLMGVPAPEPPDVVPTDTFPVVAPAWNPDSLIALGLAQNPALLAMRSREVAARWGARSAYSAYLPSLSASASTGRSQITQGSAPSYYQTSPWTLSLSVSLPIYDAAQRNAQVSQANYQDESLRQSIRAREVQVRTDVSSAYVALDAAYRTIAVQHTNVAAANEAFSLATERYRVGSGSIIELLSARVDAETAATNYITAVYNYHKAIAALEQAVGRTLR
ncbi:MAG: TolC family protein [Gemmatimonadales bacterium]|jgi:outer membrane protein TolC